MAARPNPLPLAGVPVLDGENNLTLPWRRALQTIGETGGAGITQLIGDVTTGVGGGIQDATISPTGVAPGTYTNADIVVGEDGRIIEASDGNAATAQTDPLIFAALSLLDGQNDNTRIRVQTQSGTTWTPGLTDAYTYNLFTNAAGCTVTIPAQAAVGWPTNPSPVIAFQQAAGAGQVTIQGSGFTINTLAIFKRKSYGENAVMQAIRTGLNAWTLFGAQEPV